jgi:hypothetical protein
LNANCRCHLKLLHPFSCNMNITTNNKKTWEGWKDAMLLLHLFRYNKKHTNNKKEKWKARKHITSKLKLFLVVDLLQTWTQCNNNVEIRWCNNDVDNAIKCKLDDVATSFCEK